MNKSGSIILLFSLILFSLKQAESIDLKYLNFNSVDHRLGMDASAVYSVIQDNYGLIWFGTDRGLYSFDGYQARHFSAKTQLGENNDGVIYCIQPIDSSHLYIGSDNGLLIFNIYTDSFEPIPSSLPENIRTITIINSQTLWIGSLNGLYRYNMLTREAEKIDNKFLPNPAIYSILRYDENTYFFGTYNGLCQYNRQTKTFEKISLNIPLPSSNELILSLLADYKHNRILVGVEGGLFAYDYLTGQTQAVNLFKGNSVKSLMFDSQNNLMVGTDNGLYIYDFLTNAYQLIRNDALNNRSLLNNVVWSIFIDREQNTWLGTDAGVSLSIYNKYYQVKSINELTGSHEGNQVISLLVDSRETMWLGGTNGLIKIDKKKGKTTWYQQNNKHYPLPHNKVRHIFEDSDGDIWISTDGSICRYNQKTEQFDRYQVEDTSHTRNANWAYAICQDETDKLWIATCLGGVFVADKHQLIASHGHPFIADRNYFVNNGNLGLSGNMLQFLAIDQDKNIWTGTYREGIDKIDRWNHKVFQFTTKSKENALPSDDITAMIIDSDNTLWVALRNQLLKMDINTKKTKVINDARLSDSYINAMADDGKRIWLGLSPGLFFIDKATLKIHQVYVGGNYYNSLFYDKNTQHIFAGGINQILEFDPENIGQQEEKNHLFITSLWINNKLVQNSSANQSGEIDQSIRFTSSIQLSHDQNNISISFSEFKYSQQQNVRYAYKLDGLDTEWYFAKINDNHITYNNLQPGEYTLMISRIGSDGAPLPLPRTLSIAISHPWYATLLAKFIYYALLALIIFLVVNYYLILNRLRYERLEKQKTTELTNHKIEFLTNISHELKTPLSLIIAPLSRIIEQVKSLELKKELIHVRKHALKMSSLIHQMMDASRQEFDSFGLIVSKTDIIAFTQSVVSVFEKSFRNRAIEVAADYNQPSFLMEADILKLEIILNNILSNASKFAPNNSTIRIKIETSDDRVIISISDQGPGIDAQDLSHVFERFFQSRHSLPQNKEGSGVGLSIVKEYVQLHKGTVRAISDGKTGTTIEFILPVYQSTQPEESSHVEKTAPIANTDDKPVLLVVEDNLEIQSFITKSLSKNFTCLNAANGKLGMEMALVEKPDIIVTDVMMPVMDGLEMCQKLKENIATSLIPVVMLTAKDDQTTEIQGYTLGIDAFIPKPFEIDYLSNRIQSLLDRRNLLVQKARQEAMIQPKETEVLSGDEKFLKKITQVIEDEITNPDLNVNLLSNKTGYSSKQVYRRLKALTGQTAVDYIRSVRLKKAAMLLSRKTFTVAEVMYMVGFSNHSYFAKRFQEMFGKSPKQYLEGTE